MARRVRCMLVRTRAVGICVGGVGVCVGGWVGGGGGAGEGCCLVLSCFRVLVESLLFWILFVVPS